MSAGIDPVTLSVVWNTLISITEEMGSTLRHTAFSEAVREGEDFSTGLFDRQGRLVAQGNFTPGHLGSFPYVVANALRFIDEGGLEPGDAIALNDSSLGSGHYPDVFCITPAFHGEELVGYAANCAHHVDVGGAAPGSQLVHPVTEAYQEGLRILPVKLVRAGRVDEDIERLILANVRMPQTVAGDLRAQVNANRMGVARLVELAAAHGDSLATMQDQILARSEERARECIAAIPDGVYEFQDELDDSGPGTAPIRVHVRVTVGGSDIELDFSASDDQVSAGINSYLNYTRAYAAFAVKVFTDPHVPANAGSIKPIEVVAREGTFFNPRFPAPSGGRATVQIRIFEAIAGALCQAVPELGMAGFSHWSNPNLGGVTSEGDPFVFYDLIFGGYGGRPEGDGPEALSPVLNAANIPIEVHESVNPIRVRRLALVADSGGPGTHRGGCALRKEIELLGERATLSLLGDRHRTPPFGLEGGQPGTRAETVLERDGERVPLHSKDVRELRRGDVVCFQLAGGGGFGVPWRRDPQAVLHDLRNGLISPDHAERAYGVELDPDGVEVDLTATEARRRRLASGDTTDEAPAAAAASGIPGDAR